jgi:hypothetical protein
VDASIAHRTKSYFSWRYQKQAFRCYVNLTDAFTFKHVDRCIYKFSNDFMTRLKNGRKAASLCSLCVTEKLPLIGVGSIFGTCETVCADDGLAESNPSSKIRHRVRFNFSLTVIEPKSDRGEGVSSSVQVHRIRMALKGPY